MIRGLCGYCLNTLKLCRDTVGIVSQRNELSSVDHNICVYFRKSLARDKKRFGFVTLFVWALFA